MLYSGIDLHKHSLVIHTVGEDGSAVREAEFATARPALAAYFATLPGPHRAVVECLGSWYWVRDLLGPQGIDLRLGHAKYLKAISYVIRQLHGIVSQRMFTAVVFALLATSETVRVRDR